MYSKRAELAQEYIDALEGGNDELSQEVWADLLNVCDNDESFATECITAVQFPDTI